MMENEDQTEAEKLVRSQNLNPVWRKNKERGDADKHVQGLSMIRGQKENI